MEAMRAASSLPSLPLSLAQGFASKAHVQAALMAASPQRPIVVKRGGNRKRVSYVCGRGGGCEVRAVLFFLHGSF